MVKISVGARVASVGTTEPYKLVGYGIFLLDIMEDKFVLDFLCNVKNG
jgi:hypothetical protein